MTEELAPEVLRARQLVQILALRELAEAGTLDDTAADQDWTQLQQLETWAAESDITDREWVAARDELDQRRATAAAAGEPRRP